MEKETKEKRTVHERARAQDRTWPLRSFLLSGCPPWSHVRTQLGHLNATWDAEIIHDVLAKHVRREFAAARRLPRALELDGLLNMRPPVKPRRCHLVQPAREAQVVGYRVLDGLQIHLIDRLAWRVALPLVRLLCASCDPPRAAPRHGHSSGPELMQRRLTNRPGLLQILQNSADLVPEARSRPKKRPLLLQVAAQFLEPLRVPRLVPQHPFHLLLQHVHVRFWPPLVLDAIGPLQCTQLRHRFATVVLLLHLQAQGLRIVLQGFPRSRLQQVPIPTAAWKGNDSQGQPPQNLFKEEGSEEDMCFGLLLPRL
eukprot:scaffold2663_cov256-Pinguiococcus_pyrenoidosus.AAC.9